MVSSQQGEKERFFNALYRLDHRSDNEEVPMPMPKLRKPPSTARVPSEHASVPRSLAPTVGSDAMPLHRFSTPRITVEIEPRQKPKSRKRTHAAEHPPPALVSLNPSRRKKNAKFNVIAEADQIFRGSTFYFIPNDNVAAPRKLRIQRALEYGAVWERFLSAAATHVIVDSALTMADVQKHFRVQKLPEDAVVINDVWLTESIGYREMRDTDAKRFRVQGSGETVVLPIPPAGQKPESDQGKTTLEVERANKQSHQDLMQLQNCTASSTHDNITRPDDYNAETSNNLDAILREMKELQGITLSLDDDHTITSCTSFTDSESDSNRSGGSPYRKRPKKTGAKNQFMCMEKHDGSNKDTNPNARTIEILQKMATYHDRIGDSWRMLAYRRCVTALRRTTWFVATKEDALGIPHIGDRLAAKIEEIVTTNTLRRLEGTIADPNDQLLHLFMGIYQVGYASASKWIAQGHRTLEDLETKAHLTPNQRLGLEHYHDFRQRIPRAEVAQHAHIVQRALREVDPALQGIVGGSYRRGDTDSGDIDMIVTNEGASLVDIRSIILETVVPKLTDSGFLKAALATGTARSDLGSKWHGASALARTGAPWRRIDLLFVPWSELGAALIYFTGNDIFNRSMSLLAGKKGMRLNQRGLYADFMRGRNRERMTEGRLLEGQSEEKIFEILGVSWRPPEHRKC